ncbi:DUF1161 domain-containing protein [Dyella dinghuensis]|uniref:DUF1161 domain-containing protein n=2 Tax=Dyella dinghuensis TaxID=1920169 RepID=A0A3S0RCQ3_9GAMM|nr:DUF1161 domain-containing protein [Dyella dinghuensis]
MKSHMSIVALALMALPLLAHASCDAVKSDIDAKIKAHGVNNYSLEVVPADDADKSEGKAVGLCEGNKIIVYSRGQSKVSAENSNSALPVQPAAPTRSGQTGG